MKCKGLFMFKSLEVREGGNFRNDKGEVVPFDKCYVVKADEVDDTGKINERKFKFDVKNVTLAQEFKEIPSYSHVEIEFDVNIYASGVRLNPVSVEQVE